MRRSNAPNSGEQGTAPATRNPSRIASSADASWVGGLDSELHHTVATDDAAKEKHDLLGHSRAHSRVSNLGRQHGAATDDVANLKRNRQSASHARSRCACQLLYGLTIVACFAFLLVAAYALFIVDGGGREAPFRCDVAAAVFFTITFACFCFFQIMACKKRRYTMAALLPQLASFLAANAFVSGSLALLIHATWALVQLLVTVAASCWTLAFCSITAYAWHRSVPIPRQGELPMMRALLSVPRVKILAVWALITATGYAALYWQPLDEAGFSSRLSRLEHFLLLALGGLPISSAFCFAYLCLLHRGRRLLRLKGETGNPSCPKTVWRAAVFSLGSHFMCGAFIAFLANMVVTAIAILLAQLSIRATRAKKGVAAVKPTSSIASGRQGAVKRQTLKKRVQKIGLTLFLVAFGILRVIMLFAVFLFDVSFVQSFLVGTSSRNFLLAGSGKSCGMPEELLGQDVQSETDCLALATAARSVGGVSFLFGNANNATGLCYLMDFDVTFKVYRRIRDGSPLVSDFCHGTARGPQDSPDFDFFVVSPACSAEDTGRRLTADGEQAATVYSFDMPAMMGQATGNIFGQWSRTTVDGFMSGLKGIMTYTESVGIPQDLGIRCTGIRRLAAACILLGAAMIVMILSALDIMSILAASGEIVKARASGYGSFAAYALKMARVKILEQLVLYILQVAVSSGSKAIDELYGVFRQECGYLVNDAHLAGSACPNAWHVVVDYVAIFLLCLGALLGFLVVLGVLTGSFYGLSAARWAVGSLFAKDLKLTRLADRSKVDHKPGHILSSLKRYISRLVRGLCVSCGVWFTATCQDHQCGPRQDWYEPAGSDSDPDTDSEDEATVVLVDFKAMYKSTSKQIGLVWCAIPFVGAVVSKGCNYLNENVIFAFGVDGGGTDRAPESLISHFSAETARTAQMMSWVSSASLFFILVAINVDFFGVPARHRVSVLSVCVCVVLSIAVVRVFADLLGELRGFQSGKKIVKSSRNLVEDDRIFKEGVVGQVLKHARGESTEDPLADMPACGRGHKQQAVRACAELHELAWIRNLTLPPDTAAALVSSKGRTTVRSKVAAKILSKMDEQDMDTGLARVATILVLHEVARLEIQTQRSRTAAKRQALVAIQDSAQGFSLKLEQLAAEAAREKAAEIVRQRWQSFQEAKQRGQTRRKVPDDCQKITLEFQATAVGVSQVGAWLTEEFGGREIICPQEGHANLLVSGAVEFTCLSGADGNLASVKPTDVQVCEVRHQVRTHSGENDDGDAAEFGDSHSVIAVLGEEPDTRPSQASIAEWMCVVCLKEDAMRFCSCLGGGAKGENLGEAASAALEEGTGWQLQALSTSWVGTDLPPGAGQDASDPTQAAAMEEAPEILPLFDGGDGDQISVANFQVSGLWPSKHFYDDDPLQVEEEEEQSHHSVDEWEALEAALQESVHSPESLRLAGTFLRALGTDRKQLGHEQSDKASRLLVVSSKILRAQRRAAAARTERSQELSAEAEEVTEMTLRASTPALEHVETSRPGTGRVDWRISANLDLCEALARDDIGMDELSRTIDAARKANVEPMVLAKAEEKFVRQLRKERACMQLVKAMEAGMIQPLRLALKDAENQGVAPGDFKDNAGMGVILKARTVLQEEENNVVSQLREALSKGGVLQLRRCLDQVQALNTKNEELVALMHEANTKLTNIGNKKRLVALLKMAMATSDAGLLRAAVQECEQSAVEVDINLELARKRLRSLEDARDRFMDLQRPKPQVYEKAEPQFSAIVPSVHAATAPNFYSHEAAASREQAVTSQKSVRATAALRAALLPDPPEPSILRLAVKSAKDANYSGPDLEHAEQILQGLEKHEASLEVLQAAACSRDVSDLSEAIKECQRRGVDHKKLLGAMMKLMEDQAKVARVAGDHGLGSSMLADMEQERSRLHNAIIESHGGIRVICRVRPSLRHELSLGRSSAPGIVDDASSSVQAVLTMTRLDQSTLSLSLGNNQSRSKHVKFSSVFGQDCIQAEIFSELRGLVQSAVDGYCTIVMAGGPTGSGKTFTMLGESSESRGLLPRAFDEIYAIRERDNWRANLEVDAQMVEVFDASQMGDLLSQGRAKRAPTPRLVSTDVEAPTSGVVGRLPSSAHDKSTRFVIVDGAATRRCSSKQELKKLVTEGYRNPSKLWKSRHVVLLVTLTRTNRATGTMTRGKLAFADLAGFSGGDPEVAAAYTALRAVFQSLGRGEQRPPYRDHVLTQVLEDCLGGSAKAALVLTLPPTSNSAEECLQAVSFASLARW